MNGVNSWDALVCDLAQSEWVEPPPTHLGRLRLVLSSMLKVRGLALILMRASQAAVARSEGLGALLKQINQVISGADIDCHASIGPGLRLLHPAGVVISRGSVVGPMCDIHAHVVLGSTPAGDPRIGEGVFIGPGAKLLGPVSVGRGSFIGANAVVLKSFPEEGQRLVGVPARAVLAKLAGTGEDSPASDNSHVTLDFRA